MVLHALTLAAGLASGLAPATSDTVPLTREAWVMGTRVVVTVDQPSRANGMAWSEVLLGEVRRVEQLLSTWDPASELSGLNAAATGRTVVPGTDVAAWLVRASELTRRTGGTFDISVGALIDAWDLRGSGRRPGQGEIGRAHV